MAVVAFPANPTTPHAPPFAPLRPPPCILGRRTAAAGGAMRAEMRGGSSNRRQLHRGRDLSIEAIQAVQSLKRVNGRGCRSSFDREIDSKFRRLLKLDMIAVLRELLRQNECNLALKVFKEIRMEEWYKPQVSLYAHAIEVFASNGLLEQLKVLYINLQKERNLNPEVEGFNKLLRTLLSSGLTELAVDCYRFMKEAGCEPDKTTFRILIKGLEPMDENGVLDVIKRDALGRYGDSLELLEEEEGAEDVVHLYVE